MYKEELKTIKEWEIETGIEIKNPTGFRGQRNRLQSNKYSKKAFRRCARLSEIVCKTNKGLEFLEG